MPRRPAREARPYRSHKIRACDLCRRRKSRCVLDIPGEACVMCRITGVDCYYDEGRGAQSARPWKRPNRSSGHGNDSSVASAHRRTPEKQTRQEDETLETLIDGDSDLTRIIGPLLADDAKIVHQHYPPETATADGDSYYGLFSDGVAGPVLYMKAARRRPGFQPSAVAGVQQRMIMEQILGECAEDLVNTYFERIHPSFPILDRRSLHDIQSHHTVSCQIYAISILYWSEHNPGRYPRPDTKYFWNLAGSALHEEFSNPGLSTIPCALIDLSGRPSLWMTGNAINSGRTVSLAHTIGLNRSPRRWKIREPEKDLRIRLWWGILIHDRWASFAHGVPPNIIKANYDVPKPSPQDIIPTYESPESQGDSADIFIALCSLTEVLGDILPVVFNLDTARDMNIGELLDELDLCLDNWQGGLPENLRDSLDKPLTPVTSGCSNLQLSALSVRLLLHRIRLHDATARGMAEQATLYRLNCVESALAIVNFTISLDRAHRQDFWLPYSAYHLSTTTMLLLRCALETEDRKIKEACITNAKRLMDYLEQAGDEDNWDIGSVCLVHCKSSISRLMAHYPGEGNTAAAGHISPQLYSGSGWGPTVTYSLDDHLLNDIGFDMDEMWHDFCSTAECNEEQGG